MTAPNTSVSAEFLLSWKPEGPWPLCAFHEDKSNDFGTFGPKSIEELRVWIDRQTEAERNVYFHVNTVAPPKSGKAMKDQVVRMDWFHVDLDPKKGVPIKEEQARILEQLQTNTDVPKPTVITFSGGGYQAFWKLKTPIETECSLIKVEAAEQYNVQIAKLLGGDRCHNADRIMRLPGTINWPNAAKRENGQMPVMADMILADWDLTYDHTDATLFVKAPEQNKGALAGSPNQVKVQVSGNVPRISADALENDEVLSKIESRAKVAIVQGHDPDKPLTGDNSRSEWCWFVSCAMVRARVDDDTMYSILTDPDLGISEHIRAQGNAAAQHRSALRHIQRAREHAIEPQLEKMNREYAVIESMGGKFRIACERYSEPNERFEVEFHQKDGFLSMHANKFVLVITQKTVNGQPVEVPVNVPLGKWWLTHPNRREYREVTFYPNRDFPESMNMWRGFAFDAIPGDCSLFLDHIKIVLCKGNETYYNYMIGWMANAVQNPATPGQVAVVLRGGQGTGKGTFGKMFGKLFGTHYKYVSNPKHVTGQFNFMLQDAVLVFADECFAAHDKAAESALKSLITEDRIRVEPKGVDNMDARNCVHLIMATNSEWAISADLDDRRFFVLEVDDGKQTDISYFGAMHAQMDDFGYEALMHFLTSYDLSGFDVYSCPKTTELRKQQERSLPPMRRFLLHVLTEGRMSPNHSGWKRKVPKDELVDRFKEEYPKAGGNNASLGTFLVKTMGIATVGVESKPQPWTDSRGNSRPGASRPKMWVFPSLDECRKLWQKATKSGPMEWPEAEPEDDTPPDDGGEVF